MPAVPAVCLFLRGFRSDSMRFGWPLRGGVGAASIPDQKKGPGRTSFPGLRMSFGDLISTDSARRDRDCGKPRSSRNNNKTRARKSWGRAYAAGANECQRGNSFARGRSRERRSLGPRAPPRTCHGIGHGGSGGTARKGWLTRPPARRTQFPPMQVDPRVQLSVGPTGRIPSWCASVVALTLACLPGTFSQVSLDRAPRARVGTVRAACGTQRLERCGAEISRVVPKSGGVRSAPGSASVREARYHAGHAAVLPPARSVLPRRAVSTLTVSDTIPTPDRPRLAHAGRSPPRS